MGLFIPTFIFDGIRLLPDLKKMRVFIKVEFQGMYDTHITHDTQNLKDSQ